jgi:iron complex outermembrane receptor protein
VRLISSTTGVVLLAAAGQAWAADPNQIEEVVVTAQHRSENLQDVPITIQAFTGEAMQDLGVKSTADLGQFTPNVSIITPSGAGNQPVITIRGVGLNDYNTNNAGPNGVYIDEFYISAPTAQSFNIFDLERVEVLKGPQGTLYGRNTSGGAINLVTAKPTNHLVADAHVEYSSWNTFNIEAAVGGPISETLSGRFAAVVNESDGYFHNTLTGTRENGANNFAARGQLQWKPSDDLKVLLSVRGGYLDNRPNQYRHFGTLDPATGEICSVQQVYAGACVDLFGKGTPEKFFDGAFNRREHNRFTDLASTLRVDYALPNGWDFVSITGGNYNQKKFPEDSDASPDRNLEIDFKAQSNEITQEFRLSHSTDRYNWVVGAYYLHEALKQHQPLYILLDFDKFFGAGAGDGVASITETINHQSTKSGAAFGQVEYNLTDALKLIAGARVTAEKKTFRSFGFDRFQEGGMDHFGPAVNINDLQSSLSDSKVNWRLGANYKVTPDVMVFATVSTGFKSGGFNGGFLSTDPAARERQLQPVKPETVTAYEIGLKSEFWDRRVVFNAAAFYNDYKNQQIFTLVPSTEPGQGPVNVLDNAAKVRTYGVEGDLSLRPTSELTLTAQVGLLSAKLVKFVAARDPSQPDFSGNRVPLAPKVTAALLVDWKHPVGDGVLNLQANASYKGKQFFDNSNDPMITQDGYWLANARVAYAIQDERWEVAAFVRNLTGKHYFVDNFNLSSPFGMLTGVVGTPRSFGVEINYRY